MTYLNHQTTATYINMCPSAPLIPDQPMYLFTSAPTTAIRRIKLAYQKTSAVHSSLLSDL